MGRVVEFTSMLILGMLLVLAMTHFLNGTLTEWVASKFYVATPEQLNAFKTLEKNRAALKQWQQNQQNGPANVNTDSNASGKFNA